MDLFPGVEVESMCIPDQWEGIHSPELGDIAIPKIIETAHKFKDIDMLLVSCADDPGVEELRKEFPNIPVTGGGETTVAVASKYGNKIGVLGIVDYAPRACLRMIPEKICAVVRPDGVESTLDLMTDAGKRSCIKAAQVLKDAGAEVIALACTGLTTIGIASALEEAVGIPVIDPVIAEGLFCHYEAIKKKCSLR